MNKFESELKKGNFIISECINCKEIVWPASNYCNKCFGHVKWRKPSEIGKLTNLTYLYLIGNELTDLPLEIVNLTSLRVLRLD